MNAATHRFGTAPTPCLPCSISTERPFRSIRVSPAEDPITLWRWNFPRRETSHSPFSLPCSALNPPKPLWRALFSCVVPPPPVPARFAVLLACARPPPPAPPHPHHPPGHP